MTINPGSFGPESALGWWVKGVCFAGSISRKRNDSEVISAGGDRFSLDVRENIFTIKVVRHWNRSP